MLSGAAGSPWVCVELAQSGPARPSRTVGIPPGHLKAERQAVGAVIGPESVAAAAAVAAGVQWRWESAYLAGDVGRPQVAGEGIVLECRREGEGVGYAGDEVRRLGEHARAPRVELGLVDGGRAGAGGLDAAGDEAVVLHALADALLGHVDSLGLLERRPDALDAVVGVVGLEVSAQNAKGSVQIPPGAHGILCLIMPLWSTG
jgi:hypothetical protein